MTVYKPGDRVVLDSTSDTHTRLVAGDTGTVTGYSQRFNQLNVLWDSGSSLSMLLGEGDQVHLEDPS
jgi:hypothetical protein